MNDQVAAQLEALTGLMASLQKTVNDLNGSIDKLSGSTQNMTRNMANAEKSVDGFNRLLSQNRSSTEELDESLKKSLESIEKYSTSTAEKVQKATIKIKSKYGLFFRDSEAQMLKYNKGFLRQFRNYAEEQAEIYSNLESSRLRFFHVYDTFKDHFKFFASIGTKIFKIFTNLLGTLINVGKFLITMPLKTLESILEIAHSVREEFLAITQTLENTQEFFSGRSMQGEGFKRLAAEVRGLGATFLDVGSVHARVFGYGLQGQQAMIDKTREKVVALSTLSNIYGSSYENNALLVEQSMQALGMTVEDNMFLVRRSMSEGIHPFEAMDRAISVAANAMQEFGIDEKLVAKGMNELRRNVVEFSHISEPELGRVVSQAAQLGIEAKELNAVFSKFTTFDSAAESAALLSQTFGMAIDAMAIIRAEDPMEIINQFRDGMQQTGRDFKDLNRHEKALLSQYTGLSGEALQTAMSFEGIGLSYEELQQKMEENSPQAKLQKTVEQMSESIREFANVGKQLTSPFQAMTEGMKDAIVKNTGFQRSLMGLSNSMQRIYTSVMKNFLTDDLMGTIEGVIKAFGRLIDSDVARGFSRLAREIGSFLTVMLNMDSTSAQVSRAFDNLFDTFTNNVFLERLIKIGKRMIGSIVKGFILALPALMEGFVNLLRAFNSVFDPQSAANKGMSQWFTDYIGSALDSTAKDGGTVRSAIGRLASSLGSELTTAMGNSTGFMAKAMMKLGEFIFQGILAGIKSLSGTQIAIGIAATLVPAIISTLSTFLIGKSLLGGVLSSLSGVQSAITASSIATAAPAAGSLVPGALGTAGIVASGQRSLFPNDPAVNQQTSQRGSPQSPDGAVKNTSRSPRQKGRLGRFLSKGFGFAGRAAPFLGSAATGLGLFNAGSAAFDMYNDYSSGRGMKYSNLGAVAGGALGFLGGPLGVAIGSYAGEALGGLADKYFGGDDDSNEEQRRDSEANRSQQQSYHREQLTQNQGIIEAINRLSERPLEIKLKINQSIDGQDLTTRIISTALDGTSSYLMETDEDGFIKLRNRTGQSSISPVASGAN